MKLFIIGLMKFYRQKSLAAMGLALLTVALMAAAARAHALLIKSEPESGAVLEQAPDQVRAWFGQELETRLSSMQVFDLEGHQVDSGDGRVDLNDPDHASMLVGLSESLPNGTYDVRWTAVSADDGDTTEGKFSFDVTDSKAPANQAWAAGGSRAGDETNFPVGELSIALGILLFVGLGLALYPRLARDL